jgi:hypothetical protein
MSIPAGGEGRQHIGRTGGGRQVDGAEDTYAVERRYSLPEVRLCIANTEMALLRGRGGESWLATSAYSNRQPRLVLIRPNGEFKTLDSPHAGMVMQADEMGRLVFGVRDIAVLDPGTCEAEVLARDAAGGENFWGGCCTPRLIVAGASTPSGTLAVFDRERKEVAASFTPLHPEALYHYRAIPAPDGRVLIQSSLPTCVFTLLDQEALGIEQSRPAVFDGATNHHGCQFPAEDLLYAHSGNRAILFRYPGFEVVAEIPAPDGVTAWSRKTALLDGRVVAWGLGTDRLWVLDADRRAWEPLFDGPLLPTNPGCPLACDTFVALDDGTICGLTRDCVFFRVEAGSRAPETRPLNITGSHNGAPLLLVHDEGVRRAYGSAHVLQRLWDVDLDTGEGRDVGQSGPGGGQVNDLFWDAARRKVYMGSYASCSLVEYDPAEPAGFPENPRILSRIGHGQMRPLQLVHDGDVAWMISSPKYGTLGGALSRVQLDTGETTVVRDLVPAQTPTKMLTSPDGDTIYMSMTVEGDCGSSVVEAASAHLVAFDARNCSVIRSFAPFPAVPGLHLCAWMPEGPILFADGPRLTAGTVFWSWDPETDDVRRIGATPDGFWGVFPGPDGTSLWATAHAGVGPLVLGDPSRVDSVIDPALVENAFNGVCKFPQFHEGSLWFSTGPEFVCAKAR